MKHASRREFLKDSAKTAACSAGLVGAAADLLSKAALARSQTFSVAGRSSFPKRLSTKKGLVFDMVSTDLTYADRFKIVRDVGFQVVQVPTEPDQRKAEQIKQAAEDAKIQIDSVMNMDHWKYPLSSSDPDVVEKSLAGMRTSLKNAKFWGANTVLLVPAVVNPQTSYREAWERSQKQIRTLIPLAEELKIEIGIEEVWNKFLLSPLEMVAYIKEFQSPWIRAWFDVGNVLLYGYPQDWIRTLANLIVDVHIKDFKRREDRYAWVNLGDGDADWGAVRDALTEIGYSGSLIAELKKGDEAYLREVSQRMDRLLH